MCNMLRCLSRLLAGLRQRSRHIGTEEFVFGCPHTPGAFQICSIGGDRAEVWAHWAIWSLCASTQLMNPLRHQRRNLTAKCGGGTPPNIVKKEAQEAVADARHTKIDSIH
jgi:hypothetical protein